MSNEKLSYGAETRIRELTDEVESLKRQVASLSPAVSAPKAVVPVFPNWNGNEPPAPSEAVVSSDVHPTTVFQPGAPPYPGYKFDGRQWVADSVERLPSSIEEHIRDRHFQDHARRIFGNPIENLPVKMGE